MVKTLETAFPGGPTKKGILEAQKVARALRVGLLPDASYTDIRRLEMQSPPFEKVPPKTSK